MGSAGARTGVWITDPGNLADQHFHPRGDSTSPAQRVCVPREKHPDIPDTGRTVHAVGIWGLSWGFRVRVSGVVGSGFTRV